MTEHSNRLIHETSPYLQQHAHNPVDWYPWGDEALARAQREDKPILLSIGYSACHWCHVMEHESFEDEDVARLMNELFVCIKVDREERPDLDKIYQTAHQALAGRPGGWPLNMFLTPKDHMPYFGGTYFPKIPRHGLMAFPEILKRVAAAYREQHDAITQQSASLRELFGRLNQTGPAPGVHLSPDTLREAYTQLAHQFDRRHGGFGGAPKFPHPASLEFLLRYYARGARTGRPETPALEMVHQTLTAMARGGLYDQLGGGFCRYSVDERWEIPHFEKMLYDNGPLLALYSDAAIATGDAQLGRIARETGKWVMREMQSQDGGYYSTLDADSEGHEGKFYVWDTRELRNLLSNAEFALMERHYGLEGEPNFEGQWHLNVRRGETELSVALVQSESAVATTLAQAKARLLAAREKRVRPGRDEKILTVWNGLMIRGMARAGRLLDEPDFIASAERAFDFVRDKLWRNGRLLATTKDGKSHLSAYLDDYAFLIDGGLELLQARWRTGDLEFLRVLADVLLEHFEDEQHGGFFFTADDHEQLVHRPKSASDEAIPSGNGIAAQVLIRLGHLLGDLNYLHAAERTLEALYGAMRQYPSAHCALLIALEEHVEPTQTIVLRGDAAALRAWQQRCRRHYAPQRLTVAIPNEAEGLSGLLAERRAINGPTAYLCAGHSCSTPVTDLAALEREIVGSEVRPTGVH
jgi:uncharacterized protein YyaL (SSP411 family)